MKHIKKGKNHSEITDSRLHALYNSIAECLHSARCNVVRTVNSEMVKAYWFIGEKIVEEEQQGKARAKYGKFLLKELSILLTKEFGSGFGIRILADIRKFYLVYSAVKVKTQKMHAVHAQSQMPAFNKNLSWIHYRALIKESRLMVRNFYEAEAIKNNWSGRELERQMNSLLFERLARSKDKKGLMQLALKGQEIETPEDAIKDPMILEFLDIPESHKLAEEKLESALIQNMKNFLLELGRGFAFVARQKRLTLDGDHFYADLVFYHTILKCYVIIDIKTKKLTHADLGQMLLYTNYFDQEIAAQDDNPSIGLILCTEKSDSMVKYTLGDKAKRIFASKYKFNLPTEEELEKELKKEIKYFKLSVLDKKS